MSKLKNPSNLLKLKVIIVFFVLLIAIVCMFFYKKHLILISKKVIKEEPIVTEFTNVTTKLLSPEVIAIGSVKSSHGVVLESQVSGVLVNQLVKSGAYVKKGQLLYVIYPDVLNAKVLQAKANLVAKKKQYKRNLEIFNKIKENGISLQKLENYKSAYLQAKAELDEAVSQRKLANVVAPISGFIGVNIIRKGDYVRAGDTINTIVPSKGREVYFSVPALLANTIKVNSLINYFYVSGVDKNTHSASGVVVAKNSTADKYSKMQMIEGSIKEDINILPESYVKVIVSTEKPKPVMVLPQVAVIGGSAYGDIVYQVINSKAYVKPVKIGDRRGDFVIIKSGINIGDTIVLNGQSQILLRGQNAGPVPVTDKGALHHKKVLGMGVDPS